MIFRLPILFSILVGTLGCRATPTLAAEDRARLADLWASYQREDSDWRMRRDRAMTDPIAREFLVQNFVREVVRSTDATGSAAVSFSPRAERARDELAAIGAPAVPLLVAFFSARDPAIASICSQVLAGMGELALPALREALRAPDPRLRRWAADSLSRMAPPREREALERTLREDSEWMVRGAAVEALARYEPSPVEELARALEDADPFVRRQAASALQTLGAIAAVPQLIQYLDFAVARAEPPEVSAALESLQGITRQRLGANPQRWREWWSARK